MAHLFFDDVHLMVGPVTSSVEAPGRAHLCDRVWVFEWPVGDEELVAAVREAWVIEAAESNLPVDELDSSWDPVRELFGNERYSETNYAQANHISYKGRRFSDEFIGGGASRWLNGNRDYGVEEGRFRLELDCSDEELAVAIRAAIAATTGPDDG